ncbi:hypothetical protein ACEQ8H_006283 [Pleosporales sp. CAS-2024a]
MAPSIERQLPEELLDMIISQCNRDDLLTICLTSKQLNRLATPRLYSFITFGKYIWDQGEIDSSQLQLAHLLLTSPTHAASVNSVFIAAAWAPQIEYISGKDQKNRQRLWRRKLQPCLKNNLSRFYLSEKDENDVLDKIQGGLNVDAIFALLLLCLPNLNWVDINFGYEHDHKDFVCIFELLAENVRLHSKELLPQIDVMVKGEEEKIPNAPETLAVLFHMPNLRSISGYKMDDDEDGLELIFSRLQPHSSPVKFIELRNSKLNANNLKKFMAATIPGKLTAFIYEIGCSWACCSITHPGIMESLRAHHASLQALGLSHEEFYPHQFDNEGEELFACDFKPFTALISLKVAPCYIWGHEGFTDETELENPATKEMLWKTLPPNLEQLWICRAESQTERWSGIDDGKPHFEYDCLLPALHLVVEHKVNYPKLSTIYIELAPLKWPKNAKFDNLASFSGLAIADPHRYPPGERGWGWDEDVQWGQCVSNQEARKIWLNAEPVSDLARRIRTLVKISVAAEKKRARKERHSRRR